MSEHKNKSLEDAKKQIDEAADNIKSEVVDIDFEGFKFQADTEKLDDVDALDMIDQIENQQNMKVIVDFLEYLIGKQKYDEMKAYFVKRDGRFKISKLSKIYVAIFEKFDPKD